MQIPRQENFIRQMIGGSLGNVHKRDLRGFLRVPNLKVDDAGATLTGQNGRRDKVQEANGQCANEWIVQPFGDLMVQSCTSTMTLLTNIPRSV